MIRNYPIIAIIVVLLLPLATATANADKETAVKLTMKGIDITVFDGSTPDANKLYSISTADFPATIWYLETSPNGMHHIRLKQDDQPVWVKGTRVRLPGIERHVKMACDSTMVSKTGHTGRGLGNRSSCE